MKLIKTIQNLVEEAEKEYNKVLESTTNMKEIERAEKNYFDSLKVLEKFNKLRVLCAVREGADGLYSINKMIENDVILKFLSSFSMNSLISITSCPL